MYTYNVTVYYNNQCHAHQAGYYVSAILSSPSVLTLCSSASMTSVDSSDELSRDKDHSDKLHIQ